MNPMSLLTMPNAMLRDAAQQASTAAPRGERSERSLAAYGTVFLLAAGILAWLAA